MTYYESFITNVLLQFYFKTNELVQNTNIDSSDIIYLPIHYMLHVT